MPRRTARHGTNSGYYRHLRTTRTPPCPECLTAHADATAWRTPCAKCGQRCIGELCRGCRAAHYATARPQPNPEDEIAFTGTWRNDHGIWRAA